MIFGQNGLEEMPRTCRPCNQGNRMASLLTPDSLQNGASGRCTASAPALYFRNPRN